MEWIIYDDGDDKIQDLVEHIPQVKYFKLPHKVTLGKKRNLIHEQCRGDYLVYMDDDDFYPPERVEHAVSVLQNSPDALCAGARVMHIYFKHIKKIYEFGPYGPMRSTAATFAFKRELLNITRYDDNACLAEEPFFLKNYTIPFADLDSVKSILVISHTHNSLDKKELLNQLPNPFVKESSKTVDDFIRDPEMRHFYMEGVEPLLDEYDPGRPEHKPDLLKQMAELYFKRRIQHAEKKMQLQTDLIAKYEEVIRKHEKTIQDQTQVIMQLMSELKARVS
jgi:glycosyltransferase involved in cell wall biosynthesis